MAIYVANNGSLQTIKRIYYGMTEDYINATLFHNLVPTTATEIRFLYASDNPDLTDYQRIGYCDNNNFIEVWNNGTKYILINPRKNYIYAPIDCSWFLYNYTALVICNIENFNTQNVTSMQSMFRNCNNLTSLDVSHFNTNLVTDMNSMFRNCNNLTSLDVSRFNTQNVTSMDSMFSRCRSLTSLDVSRFNTQNVTSMDSMFSRCRSLTSLDVSHFNTQNVTSMEEMFLDCRSLTSLDISNFNIMKLKDVAYMFDDCSNLKTIISNTFSFPLKYSNGMFLNNLNLVGGNGTTYDANHIDAEYARVDGEDGLPGYFTAPN